MAARPLVRLRHIKENIRDIRSLLSNRTESDIVSDRFARAALERMLEVISEASRHIPQDWKTSLGADVPWSEIASFGNVLRHAYDHVEIGILWSACQNDLAPLEAAVDAMLAAHGPKDTAP
jgi:uncharacterized protein with HEPN domain